MTASTQLSFLEEAASILMAQTRANSGGGAREPVVLLLSIRQEHAQRIFAGSKHFELRKSLPNRPLRRVFLYVSGTGGVVGGFDPAEVIHKPINALWKRVGARATTRARFFQYFANTPKGFAIRISRPVQFAQPIAIKELQEFLPGLTAPMSYLALRPDDPIAVELETARRAAEARQPPTVTLRPIADAERPTYKKLVRRHIGANYDEIDDTFAGRTLQVHDLGRDPLGFFTSDKLVLAIEDARHRLIGFTTLTMKSGGSLKSGPTILLERFRGRGFGRATRRAIEDYAIEVGARKVYCTAPASSFSTIRYLLAAGMTVEAQLSYQYTTRHDELVFGKFVVADDRTELKPQRYKDLAAVVTPLSDISRSELVSSYQRMFSAAFHDITTAKVREILAVPRALKKTAASEHASKPRHIICVASRGKCRGFVTVIPKRGGAMKAVLLRETSNRQSICQLIDESVRIALELQQRKLYWLHPLSDSLVIEELLGAGFRSEGVLRAPYRPGDDVIVISRFLEVLVSESRGAVDRGLPSGS